MGQRRDSIPLRVAIIGHIVFFGGSIVAAIFGWTWWFYLIGIAGFLLVCAMFSGWASEFVGRDEEKTVAGQIKIWIAGFLLIIVTLAALFLISVLFSPGTAEQVLCIPKVGCE